MPSGIPHGKDGLFYLLAALYRVIGIHDGAAMALVAGLGAAVIPIMFDATARRYGVAAARVTPVLLLLIPGFLLWPSQLLRDPIVYFLLAVGYNATSRLMDRVSLLGMVVVSVTIGLLLAVRADIGLVAGAGILISLTLGKSGFRGVMSGGRLLI